MNHIFIFSSLIFGVISQTIIKWRMNVLGPMPEGAVSKAFFLIQALLDPYILISILLTLLAGVAWMGAMSKFDISYAYPFTGLSYVLLLFIAALIFSEPVSLNKIAGTGLIIAGIIIISI